VNTIHSGCVDAPSRPVPSAHPETPAVINSVMFLDMPYRFSAEQPGLLGLHLSAI